MHQKKAGSSSTEPGDTQSSEALGEAFDNVRCISLSSKYLTSDDDASLRDD